ncbi:21199_t:CDS:2, partial [Racocetra persica]
IWGYTWWQDSRTTQQVAQLEQQIAKGAKNFQARQEQSKAAAIKRQKERLAQINRMKQQLVAENLSKAQTDLNNLPQRMTWEKIKQKYPEFEKRSLFLQELKQIAEKILKKEEDPVSKFLDKLARKTHVYHEATKKFTPPVSEEEQQLLTQLLLTEEQQLAICDQEAILRLLLETLELIQEQQKNNLIHFGCQKITLTTEQKAVLLTRSYPEGLKAFRFEPEQKHLLQTLAPLTQEYKYSLAAKALLNSLDLPPAKINFLVREEISPNPHTEFGEPQNPYLPCKLQYLLGQQKILRAVEKVRQEQLQQQETLFVKTWH